MNGKGQKVVTGHERNLQTNLPAVQKQNTHHDSKVNESDSLDAS